MLTFSPMAKIWGVWEIREGKAADSDSPRLLYTYLSPSLQNCVRLWFPEVCVGVVEP
jgi:hypothetical protein